MESLALIVFGTLALSLVVAYNFMTRSRAVIGILLGLVPIGLMVFLGDLSLDASVQRCLDSVCESAGLPPGCGLVEFGCNEWTGLGYALIYLGGIVDLVLYLLGVATIAVVRHFRRSRTVGPV